MAVNLRGKREEEPGIGNVGNWQSGARQIRSFFDDFLGGNPGWNNGLRQLQEMNPGWARGAEQVGSFLTGTPERRVQPPSVSALGAPARRPASASAAGELARANNRRAADRSQGRNTSDDMPGWAELERSGQLGGSLSLADALAQALELIGDRGSVNYDPQRQAARTRAGEADSKLEAMYRQLQNSYAADAPGIAASYDTATAGVNTATDQGVANINNAYDKARADQTAQLAALGIEDAAAVIAGAGQSSTADQAAAVGSLEQNRGVNSNQLAQNKQTAGTYNTRIGQAAGLEGASARAANQSALMQLLAEIDAEEQGINAQAADSRQSSALSLAQNLIQQDRYDREYADSRSDRDFDNQLQVQQLVSKLQGETAARFDPQQAISATDAYFSANGIEPTPDEWNKIFGNMVRNYSVGY